MVSIVSSVVVRQMARRRIEELERLRREERSKTSDTRRAGGRVRSSARHDRARSRGGPRVR